MFKRALFMEVSMLDGTFQDIRFALRTFTRDPGFTFAVVVTLALGIGANTAIFSVIDGALLHPIPFPDSDRLVALYQKTPRDEKNAVSYPNLLDWQRQTQTFEGIAGVRNGSFTLKSRSEAERLMGLSVSSNFFSVLRAQPLLGRTFTKEEDRRGARPVVLLGETFWKRRFAGDPTILGRSLRLNERDFTVIGIVPAGVRLDRARGTLFNDVFVPIGQNDDSLFYRRGTGDNTLGLGRLKPGVTLAQARAEMDTIMRNLAAEYPNENADTGVNAVSYREDIASALKPVLLALGGAVGFVLLIACTNVANLVLARSTGRSQEFGIRIALGAGRGRLIRQLLTESVLLSLAGGALGLLIASWSTEAALAVLPSVLPAISEIQINDRVLWFSLALSVLTGVLFGFAPAFKAGGVSIQETLRQGGRGILKAGRRPQYILVTAEVALTLMLLVGAGLMMRSLHNLWNVSPGFDPQGVLVFYTSLSRQRSASPEKTREAFRELNDRLEALPGVEAASVEVGGLPFLGNTTFGFSRENDTDISKRAMRMANLYAVGASHFKAIGIPLLRGRSFTGRDSEKSQLVTVIDEETARRVFPGQDPSGKYLRTGLFNRPVELVGIAGRVKHSGLDFDATAADRAQLYFPIGQLPTFMLPFAANGIAGIVRSKTDAAALISAVRKNLNAFDSECAVFGEQRMTDAIAGSLARRRFSLIVLGAFAAVALILSGVGIYGLVSHLVSQRTNEIGVRMTLGAQPRDIFLAVLREGATMGTIGIAIGLAGAAATTHLLTSSLFGIESTDFATFGYAALLLFSLTMLACYVPARRAVHIDPAAALRCG
jgi:predicted permease